MSNNDDNDVLKRLRDVRKKLQESLTDQGSDVQRKEESKIELVDAQHEIEKEDKARQIQKDLDQTGAKGPKLFKTDADTKGTVSDKAYKENMGVSRKRMASIQRRIKEKVESRRRMTPRQRMGLMVGILFAVVPLLFTNVLAFASCRFDFGGIEVEYRDTPGWLQISLPAENPTFISAKIGVISFSLYDRFTQQHVGSVTANVNEEIAPYETKIIDLDVFLDPATAGKWIENTINEFKISLVIRNFKYNGVTIVSDIAIPEVDLSETIGGLLGGLDLEGMLGSSEETTTPASIPQTLPASASIADVNAAWNLAQQKPVAIDSAAGTPTSSADDVMEILGIGVGENAEKFSVKLDIAVSLPKIEKMDLGPIRIMKLNASLYGPSKAGAKTQDDYTSRLACLSTLDPVTDGVVTDFSDFDAIRGIYRNGSYPLEVNLGGVSFVGARLELFKDNIAGAFVHPSSTLDVDNTTAVSQWANANQFNYPTWYFFYYLLNNGSINVAIRLEELSIELFGVKVYNIVIDKNLIPPIHLKHVLDIEETLSGLISSKPVGFFGMLGFLTETISTMGMNIPKTAVPLSSGIETDVNMDDFGSLLGDLNTDQLLAGIKETIGVNISLGLGIELINNLLDLHLGLSNVTLSISSSITDELTQKTTTTSFADAFLCNEKGEKDIYINGIGSRTVVNLNLTLYTDKVRTPFVEKFLRDLVENYTLKGTASLKIGKLVLFQENYTWAGIKISLGLESLMGMIGEDGLESLLADMIRDTIEDALSGDSSLLGSNEIRETNKISIKNPLMAPVEILSQIAFGTPFLSPVSGYQYSNMYIKQEDGTLVKCPKTAQEIHIFSNEVEKGTELTLILIGLELEAGTIPIHLGLGYTYIEIQTNSTNEYGTWKGLLGLTISDYVSLGPETTSLDLTLKLSLYPSSTLCAFFDNVMGNRTDPTVDLRIAGSLTLNFSGAYIPNLNLDLKIPKIAMSIDIQGLMDGLIGGMSSVSPGTSVIGPQRNWVSEDEGWWDGDYSKLPFMSQSFDIGELFEIGSFGISGFAETRWPHYDQGHVILDIVLPIRNNLMTLELFNVSVKLYDTNDNQIAAVYISDVVNKFSDNNYLRLTSKQEVNLYLRLELIKGIPLQNWLNRILSTLLIEGRLYASLGIGVFGCKLGPLTINSSLGPMLEGLGLDIGSLLGLLIPFNEKTLRDSPHASQDMMDLFGNFGLAYLTAEKQNGQVSPINPVGDCNFTDPMITFIAGLILAPAFNMSITEANLYLCDKNIYDRIYGASVSQTEAVKYSKIAGISFDPFPVYANNTFASNADFDDPHYSHLGLTQDNYYDIIDPEKPYLDPNNQFQGVDTVKYAQYWNSSGQGNYTSYQELTNRLYYGTFAMTELRLSLYNVSHGSYATAYPKKYWKAMGGPYFPVQVYDSAHGGWPNHKYVYHPNFSPIANLLSNVGSALSGDIAGLLSKITIGGNITINIFSMNVTLDASAPVVQDLVGALAGGSMNYLWDEIKKSWDITEGRQTPDTAYYERAQAAVSYYDDPSIPRLATAPLQSEFYTDLSIDMESLINNYAYFGLDNRNDHIFSPGAKGPTANGIQYMNNSRDMGSNWNPWDIDYKGIQYVVPGYKPGLVEFGGQNRERFVKDQFYEHYKIVVENWATSRNMLYNPFFESENLSTWVLDDNGIHYDKIADSRNWALRWYAEKYETDIKACRTPTIAAIFPLPVVPAFELGVLSAFISMWYDDSAASGRECGALAPMGYIFVNNSVFPRLQGSLGDRFFEDNYYSRSEYGNVYQDGSWVMANLRLFDCTSTKNFIGGLLGGDLLGGDIAFRFVLEATANVSLFGYEIYNLGVPQLPMGDPAGYTQRCTWNALSGSGAAAWGNIGSNGSIISDPQPPTVPWVPEMILPKFDSETWGMEFNVDSLLGGITDDILGFLMNNIQISYVGGLTFRLTITGFSIPIPIILSAWLTFLKGMLWINCEDDTTDWQHTSLWNWGYNGARPDINLGDLNSGWWTELNAYYPYDDPVNTGVWNHNPYDISGNCQSWSPNLNHYSTYYGETIYLPDISVDLDLIRLGWPIIQLLLLGQKDHMWMTCSYDVNALVQILSGGVGRGLVACVLVPAAFGYDRFQGPLGSTEGIEISPSVLTMDIGELL